MGYIYKIWNDINSKVYVGKTCLPINRRFSQHVLDAYKRRNENRPLYSAIRKYGAEHFFIDELEECDNCALCERETYWIDRLDSYANGYNATHGGDGKLIHDHEKIVDELLISPYADQVANSVGCCVETVRHIAHQHGIKLSSCLQEKVKLEKSQMVVCEDDDICYVFNSTADAARWLNDTGKVKSLKSGVRSHISECARGKRKSAYGFRWTYV